MTIVLVTGAGLNQVAAAGGYCRVNYCQQAAQVLATMVEKWYKAPALTAPQIQHS